MCVIATVVYGVKSAPPVSEMPVFTDFMKFFEFSGIVVFSMEGVGVALPIENTMKNPRKYYIVLIAGKQVSILRQVVRRYRLLIVNSKEK